MNQDVSKVHRTRSVISQITKDKGKEEEVQWNLYKAESQGTENIFHIGQVSALYKTATTKILNLLKSHYLHGAYLFISQNRQRWLL
jgi:hypothetical protein